MPRNGSGTYTLPAGNPVVTGTTVSSTVQNNTMSDIASAITQSLASNGETTPTANLPMGGFKLTGLGGGSSLTDSANFGQTINQPAAVTLASAATVNIGAALSSNITISGTTTITAFDTVADGIKRDVTFSGALTLTHNAASLILPGGSNITTAAGDCASFLSLGSGNWCCTKYVKASGAPVQINGLLDISGASGGQVQFPATQNPSSNVNTLDDYKEGTFTPAITLGGAAVGVTYNTQFGHYTKIGNRVTFNLRVTLSNKGSSTGAILITGLPYTSAAQQQAVSAWVTSASSGISSGFMALVATSSTTATVWYYAAGSAQQMKDTDINNSSDFIVGGQYEVA